MGFTGMALLDKSYSNGGLCYRLGVMQWLNRNETSSDKSPIKSCTQIIYREHIAPDIGHCRTGAKSPNRRDCMQIVDGVLNNVFFHPTTTVVFCHHYFFFPFHSGVMNNNLALVLLLHFFRFISRINNAILLLVNNVSDAYIWWLHQSKDMPYQSIWGAYYKDRVCMLLSIRSLCDERLSLYHIFCKAKKSRCWILVVSEP